MPNSDKNYRLIIYQAPTLAKNAAVLEALHAIVSTSRADLVKSLKRNRVFAITSLSEQQAREFAKILKELGADAEVERASIEASQKAWLLEESKKWVKRGLIFPGTANKIFDQYGIEERLATTPAAKPKDPKALIKAVLYIGATLIGLGIILFIAANWEKIVDSVKISGSILISLAFLHTGYLVKFSQRQSPHLANGLFLAGALSIGGTILLIGQIYHVQADSHILPLIWGALVLPLPLLMQVRSTIYLIGGLWFLSHLLYQQSHDAFFWLYPLLLGGILIPFGLRAEDSKLNLFNLTALMLSSFVATTGGEHWANLLYAALLLGLYFVKREELLRTLALLSMVMWNISFLATYENVPNLFYLLPLGYFFWIDRFQRNQERMAVNILNIIFWLFTFLYQVQERFELTAPEGSDILIYLYGLGLLLFALGRRLQQSSEWQPLARLLSTFGLVAGLFFIYLLSFRFYADDASLVNSPLYRAAIIASVIAGLLLLLPDLRGRLTTRGQRSEAAILFLVAVSTATALVLPANHFVHVLAFNTILFVSGFVFMFKGFQEKRLVLYNSGVGLFVVLIVSRYFDTLWKLMPRSLFFIFGGLLLVAWAFFFDKKRRIIVQSFQESTT